VEVRDKLPQLEEQALRGLIAGREDLARLALQRRQVAWMELETLESQLHEVEQEEQRLSLLEQRLATQIEAFHARLEVIAARYSAAEAQVRMNEVLTGISQELADLGTALQQAEEKTEHMQARASAIDQLVEAGVLEMPGLPSGDSFDRQLAQLDVTAAVDDQLAALKRQVGGGGAEH
jgi:phage shock protein A